MNRTEAGVERVLHVGVEKGVPIIGVDNGYLWSRAPKASDAPHDEVAGEIRQMESEPRRQCFVEGAVWIGGSLVIFVKQKVTTSGIVQFWQKSCKLEATLGVVVRSDGEPALLAHVKAARAMTMVSDVPLESVHEQVSKEQSPRNGLAEGAGKELKAKIRTSWEANPRDS